MQNGFRERKAFKCIFSNQFHWYGNLMLIYTIIQYKSLHLQHLIFTCKNERSPFTCICQTNYVKFNCWRDCVSFTWKLIRRCHNQFTWYKLELTCMCNISFYFLQGNILQQILSVEFLLELVNTVPFVITVSITRIYIYWSL